MRDCGSLSTLRIWTAWFAVSISMSLASAQEKASFDGLDPQAHAFVTMASAQGQIDWDHLGAMKARENFAGLTQLFGIGPRDVESTDRVLDGRIAARIYKPQSSAPKSSLPAILYFHGGGWVLGSIETHDSLCRRLCRGTQYAVISVEYRLAPEHPFPAPLDDCYDATSFIAAHAKEFGLDADRIVVAGDSAGGNLAAAVAIKARNHSGPKIRAQVLIYPVLDERCATSSYISFAQGYGLSRVDMQWFWKQYTNGQPSGEYGSPASAPSLKGLPPAVVVTAQYDILRDEGEAYAERLRQAGVPVKHRRFDGMVHGFIHFATAFDQSQLATDEIATSIVSILEEPR